jgi:hypothetical protein
MQDKFRCKSTVVASLKQESAGGRNQDRILVEMLGQVEIYLGEVQHLAHAHHEMLGLTM